MPMQTRKRRTPTAWWKHFGTKTPELMKLAIRVLSLTCSASGCERNCSTFSMTHTKRRNRLEHKRLNALAYVKYYLALQERSEKRRKKYNPIVAEEIASDDEWIMEIEDPVLLLLILVMSLLLLKSLLTSGFYCIQKKTGY
ncbi:uncharacterized protein LOC125478352 [Pyrus x bretschneideri]|uniref:uncharacterized protein LOC125478352 n=1 Tax=Pyrus x bretschneideri TaxID=225117 RepID=UPI00203013AE|nr:uncharacterized protein LOC125478352 [Pyrus x bretschneideri]